MVWRRADSTPCAVAPAGYDGAGRFTANGAGVLRAALVALGVQKTGAGHAKAWSVFDREPAPNRIDSQGNKRQKKGRCRVANAVLKPGSHDKKKTKAEGGKGGHCVLRLVVSFCNAVPLIPIGEARSRRCLSWPRSHSTQVIAAGPGVDSALLVSSGVQNHRRFRDAGKRSPTGTPCPCHAGEEKPLVGWILGGIGTLRRDASW